MERTIWTTMPMCERSSFAKAAPLSGVVELGLGPDAPLLVKYDLERSENGILQFYLAPKIDE